jgi:hypothetical protein
MSVESSWSWTGRGWYVIVEIAWAFAWLSRGCALATAWPQKPYEVKEVRRPCEKSLHVKALKAANCVKPGPSNGVTLQQTR